MLAARLHGPKDLRVEEVPFAKPGPGEITVEVKAAAICGTDIRAFQSGMSGVGPDSPRVLGHELAGEVAAVGRGVRTFSPGQRVTVAPNVGCGRCSFCASGQGHMCPSLTAIGINVDGGFAEYVRIPDAGVSQGNVVLLPDHISYAQASLIEPLACCYNCFEVLRPSPGEYLMIYGAGPIGVLHMLLAKMISPTKVILVDPLPDRLASAAAFGADVTLDPGRPDFAEIITTETKGHGVDVTIVACPSPQAQADALRNAAIFGRVCFFGGLPKDRETVSLNSNAIHYKQLTVTGTTRSSNRHYVKALNLVASGLVNIAPLITGEYRLRGVYDAFADVTAGRGLKTIVIP